MGVSCICRTVFLAVGMIAMAQTSAELEQLLDDAKRRLVRLAPSAFPGLPRRVIADLERRRCTIPQSAGPATPNNVIRGEFARPGQIDFAVLCSVNQVSSILVFWSGSAETPADLEPFPDSNFLWIEDGVQGSPFGRSLRTVGANYILEHNREPTDLDAVPSLLDHQGIEDGAFDKGSSIHYFHNGTWLTLAGAD